MKCKTLILCLILLVNLLILGCAGKTSNTTGQITGTAKLDGSSNYTGIVVTVLYTTRLSTTTASDGSYSISDVPAGTVTFNFSRGGYASQSKVITVTGGTITYVDTVTLSSSYGGLTGTAKLEEQTDHSDISVSISIEGYNSSATTNSSGEFSFPNLTPGTVTLNFSKSGFDSVSTTNTISAWATTNVSVTLNITMGSITGTVTIGGSTIEGMTVTIQGTSTSTTTDSDGNFSFSDILPDTYTLVFTHDDYVSQTQEVTVTANSSTSTDPLSSNGTITGTVNLYGQTDNSGVTAAVNGTTLNATTDTDGIFTISDVLTGTYTLTITKSGYFTITSNVIVEAGKSTDSGTVNFYKQANIENQYSMSSVLSGTILAMTYVNNFLYISTTEQIYKVDINNPTAANPTSQAVTNNFTSMFIGGSGGSNVIIACYSPINPSSSPTGMIGFAYDDETLNQIGSESSQNITAPIAITRIATDYYITYAYKIFFKSKVFDTQETYNVNEEGIISLEVNDSKTSYYACNSTNIYKYNSDFSSVSAATLGTSDLVGISFDETNIWVIDATTKKLYKITDNL